MRCSQEVSEYKQGIYTEKHFKVMKFFKTIFQVYLVVLFFIVFLTPNRYNISMRQYNIQVVPLATTIDGLKGPRGQQFWPYWIDYFGNLVGNIILFIPMGFLLKVLEGFKRDRHIVLTGIGVSIFIELIQLVFKIGVCDIDDVILNTFGVIGGVWLFKLLRLKV